MYKRSRVSKKNIFKMCTIVNKGDKTERTKSRFPLQEVTASQQCQQKNWCNALIAFVSLTKCEKQFRTSAKMASKDSYKVF